MATMYSGKKIIGIGVAVAVLAVAIAAASLLSSNDGHKEEESTVHADIIMPIKVSRPGCEETDGCYVPSLIVIGHGEQVTWVNEDSAFHSVTSGSYDKPTKLFDSGYLDPFESFEFDFDEIGTFDYFCTLHPWMKGQVVVK